MAQRLVEGELVVLTGANGYVAGHVADILLARGYRVRGTVRREHSLLTSHFQSLYGKEKFETFMLNGFTNVELCRQAFDGAAGVIHLAADTTGGSDWETMVSDAVQGITTILRAAAATETVRSVVMTSTVCTSELPRLNSPRVEVTSETWNLSALESLKDGTCSVEDKPTVSYAAAKTEAERAFWSFIKDEKPRFVANSVLPSYNMGPMMPPQPATSTMRFVSKLLQNDDIVMKLFPPEWHVDVRDTALLHVAALLNPDCTSERLFACSQPYNWTDVLKILKELRPDAVLPQAPPNEGRDGISYNEAKKRSEEVMRGYSDRMCWISLKDSIAAGIHTEA